MQDLRQKYRSSWLKTASLDELQTARAEVLADSLNPQLDMDYRSDLDDLLYDLDSAIDKKKWKGQESKGPAFHREHGWYLANDD